ncbi:MAG: LuxR C-terminal-related transcriptional regulator, partial [Duncaniella sp.]|nr:LuxR C-terminal-related transcriptional regulator [Duncaniella sp.]
YAVLMDIIVNDRRYQEVADDMDVSVNTVKSHLHRAMRKLRGDNILTILIIFNQISVTQIQ